jgi:isoleucyl-tRNA synthetase
MEKHNYHKVAALLTTFVNDDLSRWYIKLIRDRANEKDEKLGYVFWYVFDRVLRLLGPFTPYITEYIYDDLFKRNSSIHLESWPKEETTDKLLEEQMRYAREIVTEILAQREKANIGVRWPLQQATIKTAKKEYVDAIKRLADLIKQQTNIKKISVDAQHAAEKVSIVLDTIMTPELEAEGFCRELCRKIQSMRKEAGLKRG